MGFSGGNLENTLGKNRRVNNWIRSAGRWLLYPRMRSTKNHGVDPRAALTLLLLCASLLGSPGSYAARNDDKRIGWPGQTLAGKKCVGKEQGFGPFDYTDPTYTTPGLYTKHGSSNESPLRFVEKAHFHPSIEQLQDEYVAKKLKKNLPSNIDYTLRAFPNHHRALYTLINYQMRHITKGQKTDPRLPKLAQQMPAAECYFIRAEVFTDSDATVWMLHGLYLHRRGLYSDALEPYSKAVALAPNDAQIRYNLGLLYYDLGRYEDAREEAVKAKAMGYPMPGLIRKLERSGNW
jgi:tetratricopeptide (TPR) repeat protein